MNTEELTAALRETDARSRENARRIDRLEERQDNFDRLVTSVATMAAKQESMETDITEIKSDVKTLTGLPGKRWEQVVEKVILGIIAAMLGVILSRLGL